MNRMYALIVEQYYSGASVPFATITPAVSESEEKLRTTIFKMCKEYGEDAPEFTEYGWRFWHNGVKCLATIERVLVI